MTSITVSAECDDGHEVIVRFVDCQRVLQNLQSTSFLICDGRPCEIIEVKKEIE